MFPFSFEWVWDVGHLVFHGGLWYALNIIGAGMMFCLVKSILETYSRNDEKKDCRHR